MAVISLCLHCGDGFKTKIKLCGNCNTAEKRAVMDAENRANFELHGLKFHCRYCEGVERRKEAKRLEKEAEKI